MLHKVHLFLVVSHVFKHIKGQYITYICTKMPKQAIFKTKALDSGTGQAQNKQNTKRARANASLRAVKAKTKWRRFYDSFDSTT